MPYRPEIDGLRALAVLPVIFHHAGFGLFSGGYVGVDVFFVISGYLITGIIHREIAGGTFSLVRFYERRIRRILPALFLVSMACVPFAAAWLLPDELRDFGRSLVAVNLFASNILFWREIDYFAPDAALKPLLHTWSLAVEEQFYLLFPLLLLLLRRFREPALVAVLLLLSALSLGLAQWASGTFAVANFYLLPTRAWELGLGAIIAIALGNGRLGDARAGQVASILGLVLVLYAVFAFDPMLPFPSFWTLVPVLGTGLLLAGAGPGNPVGRLLSLPPLVGIGLISYSAYLWHQPLFVFARIRHISELESWQHLGLVVLTLVLAWVSWLLVERPFRQRGRVSARRIFVGAATVSVLLLAVGGTIEVAKGFPGRELADGQTLAELQSRVRPNQGLGRDCGQTLPLEAKCRTSEAPEILVWGDSFAMHLSNGILADTPDAAIAQMTMAVCGPILGLAPVLDEYRGQWSEDCLAFNERVIDWLGRHPSVRYVALASPFAQYLDPANAYLVDGRVIGVDGQRFALALRATLARLETMGIRPVVFAPPPNNGVSNGRCLVYATLFDEDLTVCDFALDSVLDAHRRAIEQLHALDDEYEVVWLDAAICADGTCRSSMGDVFVFGKGSHLSHEGAALLGRRTSFFKAITGAGAAEAQPVVDAATQP